MSNKEKDWTGNYNSIFKTLGASNHTDKEREVNDYYATDKGVFIQKSIDVNNGFVLIKNS